MIEEGGDRKMQLLFDAEVHNTALLTDKHILGTWLRDLAGHLGLKLLDCPHVWQFPEGPTGEPGLTGIAVLMESSIVAHTYPEYHTIFLDFFSCVDFDLEKFIDRTKREGIICNSAFLFERGVTKEGVILSKQLEIDRI